MLSFIINFRRLGTNSNIRRYKYTKYYVISQTFRKKSSIIKLHVIFHHGCVPKQLPFKSKQFQAVRLDKSYTP